MTTAVSPAAGFAPALRRLYFVPHSPKPSPDRGKMAARRLKMTGQSGCRSLQSSS